MTDTAKLADVVLPATMFLEHDDIYKGGGNQHIMLGPKLIDPPDGAARPIIPSSRSWPSGSASAIARASA